jgi:hypothetical protein
MRTHEAETYGMGAAAKEVASHASAIGRLELRLAIAELKDKLAALGLGIGLAAAAFICALYGLGFAAATIAAALATALATWLALLIVGLGFVLLAGLLGLLGLRALRRGMPPIPKQAIEEAKLTTEAVKGHGSHS